MPTQQLDFPFAGGIDEKTRGELVEPGAALGVNNLRQLKNGSYEKRQGNLSLNTPLDLSGNNTIPTQKRLVGYRDEVCSTDNLNLYSYLSSVGGRWKKAPGYTPQLDIKATSVAPTQNTLYSHHVLYLNGYQILVYTQGDRTGTLAHLYVEVLDAQGIVVIPPRALNVALTPDVQVSLTSVDNLAVVCYGVDNSRTIYAYTLDTTSPASVVAGWSSRANLVTNMALGKVCFDTCSLGASFVLAYVDTGAESAAVQQLTVVRFNSALAAQATNTTINTGAAAGGMTCVSVSGNSADVVFVAYSLDTTFVLECVGLHPSTLVLTASRTALSGVHASALYRCTVLWTATNNGIAMYNDDRSRTGGGIRKFTVAAGAVVPSSGTEYLFYGLSNETKLFAANSRVYSGMRPSKTNLGTDVDNLQLLLIDWTATLAEAATVGDLGYQRVAGNINPRLSIPTSDVNRNPSCIATLSSTNVVIPTATRKSAIGASIDLVSLDWAATTMSQAAVLGDDVALSGSPPSFYDGVRVSEIGFFQKPTILSNTVTGVAGPDSTSGNYNYVAIFEQMDNRGQWHQSDISIPFLPNPQPVNNAVALVCSTLGATNRMDFTGNLADTPQNIRVVFYRTTAGGTIYYRVPGSEVGNVPNAPSITFSDAITDAYLLAHGTPLYTQPGIPNVAQAKVTPPCFTAMFTHGNRLIGLNDKSVWFSGEYVLGDGYWFADVFQFAVEGGDGDLVAGASMDGAMVLFKRNAIAFVDGSGPPDNGAGGDFSPPQFIAADVGCIEPRSVVLTPAGVMFQSLRGIEMLSRGRSLSTYFGSHAEATLAANPVITSAVLDEAKATVTFTCLPSESAFTGVEIVWDYVHNIWLTDGVGSGAVPANVAIKSATMAGHQPGTVPVRTWLAASGVTHQETSSTYLDVGVYVSGSITAPWVKMSGLQGYGRTCGITLLLESRTPCDVLVTIRLDYRSDVVQTRLFTAAEIATLGTPTELYVTFKTQKCSSFQVTLTDATPTGGPAVGTGQGPAWIGMRIEYQQKQGTNRTTRLAGA